MFTKLSTSFEMKVFLFLNLLFGYYFKAFSSKTASTILRIYCCLVTITTLFICSWTMVYLSFSSSSWLNVFELTISFIMSQITSQKYLVNFLNTMSTLDCVIGFKANAYLLNKMFFLTLTAHVVTIIWGIPLGPGYEMSKYVYVLSFFVFLWISTELRYCKLGIIIGLIHHRFNLLRKCLEKNDVPINFIGFEGIKDRIYVVRKSLIYYDNLLEAFDAINYFMQFEVILICVVNLLKWVLTVHTWISIFSQEHVDVYIALFLVINTGLEMTMAFSPCTMMVLCNSEIDNIKKTLVLQIISCSDVSLRKELENLLKHVTRRPLHFTLLRAVPVDLYLLISIISSSITYVILFLQITHFGVL